MLEFQGLLTSGISGDPANNLLIANHMYNAILSSGICVNFICGFSIFLAIYLMERNPRRSSVLKPVILLTESLFLYPVIQVICKVMWIGFFLVPRIPHKPERRTFHVVAIVIYECVGIFFLFVFLKTQAGARAVVLSSCCGIVDVPEAAQEDPGVVESPLRYSSSAPETQAEEAPQPQDRDSCWRDKGFLNSLTYTNYEDMDEEALAIEIGKHGKQSIVDSDYGVELRMGDGSVRCDSDL